MRDLAFGIAFTLMLPIGIVSSYTACLIWVWVAMLSPSDVLSGFLAGFPFNKVAAGMAVIALVVSKDKKSIYLDATGWLLLLLCASATVSWIGAINPSDGSTDLYQKLLKEALLALALMAVMVNRQRLHLLALTLVISLSFVGVKEGLISVLTAGGHKIIGSGNIGDNNSLATALLMVVPLGIYLYQYSAVRVVRLGMLASLVLNVITVIMTFSRGGFIGLVLVAGFFIKSSNRKFLSFVLVAFAGLAVVTLAPDTLFNRLNTMENLDNEGSFMGRVVAWKISWLIAMDHPLFGGGPHAVQNTPLWLSYVPKMSSLAWIPTPPPDLTIAHAAHSIYFEVLGDLGFVGLGLFMALLIVPFWNCYRIVRMTRGKPELLWARDLARMAQMSMAVYVVTAAALSMAYFELLYIFVAMISRLRKVVEAEVAEEAKTARTALLESTAIGAKSKGAAEVDDLTGPGRRPVRARGRGRPAWQPGPLAR